MKTPLLKCAVIAAAALATSRSAFAESALFGWQAIPETVSYVSRVHMTGPTARNKSPGKRGVFKGEFFSFWGSKLTDVYKLSLDKNGAMQSQKLEFTISPVSNPETVETNGVKSVKIQFETQSLAFEPGESFVLIFRTKADAGRKDWTEMVMLRIT